MALFSITAGWAGNLDISPPAITAAGSVSVATTSLTRMTNTGQSQTDLVASYDCSRQQETKQDNEGRPTYVIAPGPYLAVSGPRPEATMEVASPGLWLFGPADAPNYVFYSPSCKFANGGETGTTFTTAKLPAGETVEFEETSGNELVFVLPPGTNTSHEPQLLAIVWVCDDGSYLVGSVPR